MTKALYLFSYAGLALIVALAVAGFFAFSFHQEREFYKGISEELAVDLEKSRADNVKHLTALVSTRAENSNLRQTVKSVQLLNNQLEIENSKQRQTIKSVQLLNSQLEKENSKQRQAITGLQSETQQLRVSLNSCRSFW